MIEEKMKDGENAKKYRRNKKTEDERWREKTKKYIRSDRRKDERWRKNKETHNMKD